VPIGNPNQSTSDPDSSQGPNDAHPPHFKETRLDADAIAASRAFFELLDQWDRKEKADEA